MEIKHVLITGSSGFIGRHLGDFFRQNAISYVWFSGDLLRPESIEDFFSKNQNISEIVHLVGTFEGDLGKQIEMNFQTTANLLECAHKRGIKKIIFASTGAVYGEPLWEVSLEDDPPSPNTWYGFSKKIAEDLVSYYARNYGWISLILRFPNVYGPWSRGVIPVFLRSIEQTGKITIYGDGEQSRNFLHVSDAVRAISLALSHDRSEVFNITNPHKTSLNDLVAILKKNFQFEVEYLPQNTNNLRDLLLSPEKSRRLLGFEAKIKNISLV
jgi:UDP-glucose 4-epimerase